MTCDCKNIYLMSLQLCIGRLAAKYVHEATYGGRKAQKYMEDMKLLYAYERIVKQYDPENQDDEVTFVVLTDDDGNHLVTEDEEQFLYSDFDEGCISVGEDGLTEEQILGIKANADLICNNC